MSDSTDVSNSSRDSPTVPSGSKSLRAIVDLATVGWTNGQPGRADEVLRDHPELMADRSVVLDLIYEEFCQRRDAGQLVASESFCNRFPSCLRNSIAQMLWADALVGGHPDLARDLDAMPWPVVGGVIQGFEIVEELGRGALARAYLAREQVLGDRLVVIKVASMGGYEAATLGKLVHPNIVRVHSVCSDPVSGRSIICMSFHGRATLGDALESIKSQPFPPRNAGALLDAVAAIDHGELPKVDDAHRFTLRHNSNYVDGVLEIGRQLAEALAFTHRAGIFHRDIKPSNIVLTASGSPLLFDFNLAIDAATNAFRLGGTVPYMAPEQIEAVFLSPESQISIDGRADIYSLGVVLYQMIFGNVPITPDSTSNDPRELAKAMFAIQCRQPSQLPQLARGLDSKVVSLLQRCLRFDANARFQTANELVASFNECLGIRSRLNRWAKSHRRLVGSAILASAAIATGAVGFVVTREPFEVREYQRARSALDHGHSEEALLTLTDLLRSGNKTAPVYIARGDALRRQRDYVAAVSDYQRALDLEWTPTTAALQAYCVARIEKWQMAAELYREAIAAGLETANAFCNRGYALYRASQWSAAISAYEIALEKNPELQQAVYGRGLVYLQLGINKRREIPKDAIRDIEHAMTLGPMSGQLYYHAARAYSMAARVDKTYVDRGLSMLRAAMANGVNLNVVRDDLIFDSVRPRGTLPEGPPHEHIERVPFSADLLAAPY